MKSAVVVIGSHFVGKSKTINVYLKPKLGLTQKAHVFTLNEKDGFILSQSFEEADRSVDEVIKKYGKYYYFVVAARPKNEEPSNLCEVLEKLSNAGFIVHTVIIDPNDNEIYYDKKADEIINYLKG
ncbi:hypothetical protein MSP8886_01343 [Marinomonas spartinae]|uniref:Ras family protein n=1 Tax=Marinomonas spartinae TaxID=1792290 RepID=A0A1A8T8Y6_9GAMM|nr:hypothetical protein [Marinomonas spartinae]SBS28870.1 hypothetical protein MSP8886_01343 [Marinomonas spartinae]